MYNLKRIGFGILGALCGALLFMGVSVVAWLVVNWLDRYVFGSLTALQAALVVLGIFGGVVGVVAALDLNDELEDYDEGNDD